jgi:hypothetical protein
VTRRCRLEEERVLSPVVLRASLPGSASWGYNPSTASTGAFSLLHAVICTLQLRFCTPVFTAPCHGTHVTSWTCQRLKRGAHVPQKNSCRQPYVLSC